jgi:hypothetical protein
MIQADANHSLARLGRMETGTPTEQASQRVLAWPAGNAIADSLEKSWAIAQAVHLLAWKLPY